MNPDKIRKAVELADGFETLSNGNYWMEYDSLSEQDPDSPFPYFLDALAAQLVRQVDAIHHFTVVTEITISKVEDWAGDEVIDTAIAFGNGRTENTINAILDSGVLET